TATGMDRWQTRAGAGGFGNGPGARECGRIGTGGSLATATAAGAVRITATGPGRAAGTRTIASGRDVGKHRTASASIGRPDPTADGTRYPGAAPSNREHTGVSPFQNFSPTGCR